MKRFAALLALIACSSVAHSDEFHTLVGLKCNAQTDRLIVYYVGAYNEAGETLVARKNRNEWVPGDFITSMKDDDHIGDMEEIVRTCKLSHGTYEIRVGPRPGNMNIQGQCGAQFGAWVEIRREGQVIVSRRSFEPWCQDLDGEVLTRITIDATTSHPRFRTVKYNNFLH